jgi:hypothetical protein
LAEVRCYMAWGRRGELQKYFSRKLEIKSEISHVLVPAGDIPLFKLRRFNARMIGIGKVDSSML